MWPRWQMELSAGGPGWHKSGKGDRSPVCMTLTPSAWWLLVLAVPVLLAGEALLRRVPVLVRCNIPASVAGGLLAAALVLGLQATGCCSSSGRPR